MPDEVRRLQRALSTDKHPIDWNAVAEAVRTKTPSQCVNKHRSGFPRYKPRNKTPRAKYHIWNTAESCILYLLVKEHGRSWTKIAKILNSEPNSIRCKYRSIIKSGFFRDMTEEKVREYVKGAKVVKSIGTIHKSADDTTSLEFIPLENTSRDSSSRLQRSSMNMGDSTIAPADRLRVSDMYAFDASGLVAFGDDVNASFNEIIESRRNEYDDYDHREYVDLSCVKKVETLDMGYELRSMATFLAAHPDKDTAAKGDYISGGASHADSSKTRPAPSGTAKTSNLLFRTFTKPARNFFRPRRINNFFFGQSSGGCGPLFDVDIFPAAGCIAAMQSLLPQEAVHDKLACNQLAVPTNTQLGNAVAPQQSSISDDFANTAQSGTVGALTLNDNVLAMLLLSTMKRQERSVDKDIFRRFLSIQ